MMARLAPIPRALVKLSSAARRLRLKARPFNQDFRFDAARRHQRLHAIDVQRAWRQVINVHTARFGEIEQRGAALTPKGRALYDRLLAQAGTGSDNQQHQQHLSAVFRDFPDDEQTLREQELAWFRYRLTPQGEHQPPRAGETVAQLLATGRLQAEPIVYSCTPQRARLRCCVC
jgi:uncharacterized glyoxalase superfamily metalloenzyme YdcJ